MKDFFHQQTQLQNQEHQRTRQTVQEETAKISNKMQSMYASAQDQKARDKLLNSLFFPDMNARKNQISAAHPDTFEWLFKQNSTDPNSVASSDEIEVSDPHNSDPSGISELRNSFHDWLKHGQQVYWISGKPGSGKSTLMSFIAEHELTREYLEDWNRSKDLVLLESYLWNAGAENQRAFRGVLATLLTQILERSSLILDSVLHKDPNLGRKLTLMDWSVHELEKWLLHCLNSSDTYFCVFIDGLDEAEVVTTSPNNPILHFIESAAALTNVKCCISSRPLRQFEVAFKDCPHLRLQDLNANDIRKYFDDNAKPIFKSSGMNTTSSGFSNLQHDFCSKADGVFLWACLAVGSLKRGVDNRDDIRKLQERLEELPPELEDLYCHMWNHQNKDVHLYQDEASLFLNVHLKTTEQDYYPRPEIVRPSGLHSSLSLLHLIFIQPDNHYISCEALAGKISKDLIQACQRIQAQITSRCAGLLEVVGHSLDWVDREKHVLNQFPALQAAYANRVEFVHRTARDFLLTSTFGQSIRASSKHTDLELRRLICRARLCEMMITSVTPQPRHLEGLMIETVRFPSLPKDDIVVLVDDIERAFKNRVLSSQEHLDESSWFTFYELQQPAGERTGGHYLAYDFLAATLVARMPWSVMDELNDCIQGCSFAYRLHLMFYWLQGLVQFCHESRFYMEAIFDTFLNLLWKPEYCSKELLRYIAYPKFFSKTDQNIAHIFVRNSEATDFSVRMCAADILLQTLQNLFLWETRLEPTQLSFFERLLSLPFPRDQQLFLFGHVYPKLSDKDYYQFEWSLSAPPLMALAEFDRTNTDVASGLILQYRLSFLLRIAIQCVETRYGVSLHHLSKKLPAAPSRQEIIILSITDTVKITLHEREHKTVKVDRADSSAIVTLLGYDGPSGHEKFSNDLWGHNRRDRTGLSQKLVSVLEHGKKIDYVAHLKDLGIVKDIDDPEAGQWPPPLWDDKASQGRSGGRREEASTVTEHGHDTSTPQDHDSGSKLSQEDSSDDGQYVDASEEFS